MFRSGSGPKCAPRKLSHLEPFVSLAIKKGQAKEVFNALLDDNVNVQETDTGDTALHLSIAYHKTKISKKLLQCKSLDINAVNFKGQTPLLSAIFHRNETAINQLIKRSGELKPDICDSNGNNILHYAAIKSLSPNETKKLLSRLQKSHGDLSHLVNQQNSTGVSYLSLLLPVSVGNTSLHEAVEHGSLDLEKLFLAYDPSLLKCRNSAGETPLDISLRLRKDSQAAMLLSVSPPELYPADLLTRLVDSNMDQLLNELFIAISKAPNRKGNVVVMGYLFTSQSLEAIGSRITGVYNQSVNNNKGSHVHYCILHKKNEILKVLLTCPDVDLAVADGEGNTPLHLVLDTKYYSYEVFRYLVDWLVFKKQLSEGKIRLSKKQMKALTDSEQHLPVWSVYQKTVINKQNRQGHTPLIRVFLSGLDETTLLRCIQELVNLGADVTLPDRKGNTPLYYTVTLKNVKCVELLRVSGASAQVTNSDGVSPLDVALMQEDEEMINALTADVAALGHVAKSKKKFW